VKTSARRKWSIALAAAALLCVALASAQQAADAVRQNRSDDLQELSAQPAEAQRLYHEGRAGAARRAIATLTAAYDNAATGLSQRDSDPAARRMLQETLALLQRQRKDQQAMLRESEQALRRLDEM